MKLFPVTLMPRTLSSYRLQFKGHMIEKKAVIKSRLKQIVNGVDESGGTCCWLRRGERHDLWVLQVDCRSSTNSISRKSLVVETVELLPVLGLTQEVFDKSEGEICSSRCRIIRELSCAMLSWVAMVEG